MKQTLRTVTALLVLIALASVMVFAATTPLTVVQLKQNNYAVQAGDLTIPFTACDATNGNSYAATGLEVLLVMNTDSSAHTFTITSAPDPLGRLDTSLTGYSVLISPGIVGIQMKNLNGWAPGNVMTLSCNSTMLKYAVLRTN